MNTLAGGAIADGTCWLSAKLSGKALDVGGCSTADAAGADCQRWSIPAP